MSKYPQWSKEPQEITYQKYNNVVSWSIKIYSILLSHISHFLLRAPPHIELVAHKTSYVLNVALVHASFAKETTVVCASVRNEFAKKIRESFTVFKALNCPFQNSTVPLTTKGCLHNTTQSLRAKSTISSTFNDKLHLGSDFLQKVMLAPPFRKPCSERWRISAYHSFRNRTIFGYSFCS